MRDFRLLFGDGNAEFIGSREANLFSRGAAGEGRKEGGWGGVGQRRMVRVNLSACLNYSLPLALRR